MLTAKHISDTGSERVFEVASFRFEPGDGEAMTCPTIWLRINPADDEHPITGGTVFLMNSNGSTIGRYGLHEMPSPIGSVSRRVPQDARA
jgi:hypothetical protein